METVAENLLKVNEGIDKVESLNAELAETLYGGDTGYRGYYDEFWNAYQQNGNRTDHTNAFSGQGWTDVTFNPKYNIRVSNAYMMFRESKISDLDDVTIDFSPCVNASYAFYFSSFVHLGVIDFSNVNQGSANIFSYSERLESIDRLILGDKSKVQLNGSFNGLTALKNLIIDGVISENVLFQWSTMLSKASITSVINALSSTTSGLTITFSKTAVENAFGGTGSTEWATLIATKSNWTISLV